MTRSRTGRGGSRPTPAALRRDGEKADTSAREISRLDAMADGCAARAATISLHCSRRPRKESSRSRSWTLRWRDKGRRRRIRRFRRAAPSAYGLSRAADTAKPTPLRRQLLLAHVPLAPIHPAAKTAPCGRAWSCTPLTDFRSAFDPTCSNRAAQYSLCVAPLYASRPSFVAPSERTSTSLHEKRRTSQA